MAFVFGTKGRTFFSHSEVGCGEMLDTRETEIGTFHLLRRQVEGVPEWIYEILIGDEVLMTSLSPFSERALSTRALEKHQGMSGLRVLVGGLGLGFTALAALEDPRVAHIRIVEKMDFIIDWVQSGLVASSSALRDDPRVQICEGDVYSELLGPAGETYDLILIDVDHAPDAPLSDASLPFYSAEGQKNVSGHLRRGGVLGVWSEVEDEDFLATLKEVYSEAEMQEVRWQDQEFPEADYQNALFFARC